MNRDIKEGPQARNGRRALAVDGEELLPVEAESRVQ